jgi:hypothetical protein
VRRHPALQELSRDHQHALAVAMKLRREQPGAAAALGEFLEAEARIVRMLLDHVRLRAAGAADDLDLAAAGELLDAHVRLEEREVFPGIEDAMPEEALERLGRALRGV